ncbi:MAG: TonB family protein, partial [Polyangiales bacterium]
MGTDAGGPDAGAVPDAGAAAAHPQLTPPELESSSEVVYPSDALAQRLEASVLLQLSIDAAGAVTDAQVLEPAGHGFDESARSAALGFRFRPATRDGRPIAARIRYVYLFKLPPEPEPVVAAPEPAPPPPPPVSVAPPATPITVSVHGKHDGGKERQHSAEAVNVIDTRAAKLKTTDLAEVLARSQGVSVQRDAGLGSGTTISLNGLYGAAVKFFVDGIPLEQSGFPALADIPINLVERIEVYRGVVPIRFGADAMGGAINVITNKTSYTHLGGSYQIGSFGTHRATVEGRYQPHERGFVVGGAAAYDYSDNSYKIDVRIPDTTGRISDATIRRFHDAYEQGSGSVEVGLVNLPWARRLFLRGFANASRKEYQTSASQTVVYGEVYSTDQAYGSTLSYDVDLARDVYLELNANYTHTQSHWSDQSSWVYDWYGNRSRPRRTGGETDSRIKSNRLTWENVIYGRALLQWTFMPRHFARLTSVLNRPWQDGTERIEWTVGDRDRGAGRRSLTSLVTGAEYEANAFDERLANIAFVKHYWQNQTGEEPAEYSEGDVWIERTRSVGQIGFGDSLRYLFGSWLWAKASYEYATRLPDPEEFLGDGQFHLSNYELRPEVSHNVNTGLRAELNDLPIGQLVVDVNGFVRDVNQLIMDVGTQRITSKNVAKVRSLGLDSSISWQSPGRYVTLNGMYTWNDIRTPSGFGDNMAEVERTKNQRVPSQPWMFASWGARLSFPRVFMQHARLEPFYDGRFVHSYDRSWDNQGDPMFKIVMPSFVTQSAGVSWIVNDDWGTTS